MKKMVVILMMILGVILSGGIVYSASVPMPDPDSIQIVPPDPSLPKELTAFSGKWKGIWRGRDYSSWALDAVLIVEKIEEEKAVVIYCWGTAQGIEKGGWRRYRTATITKNDGKYVLSFGGEPRVFKFWLKGEKLEGFVGPIPSDIVMKRVP